MRTATRRQIIFFDTSFHSGVENSVLPIHELAPFMIDIVNGGRSFQATSAGKRLFGFRHAREVERAGKRYLALLALSGDPEAPESAVINVNTNEINIHEREEHEAAAAAAHILLDLDPIQFRGTTHRAVMEVAVGLGKSVVTPAIARLVRSAIEEGGFQIEREDGTRRQFNSKVILDLHAEDALRENVERGELKTIVLSGGINPDEFDMPDGAVPTRKNLRLRIEIGPDESQSGFINRMLRWGRNHGFNQLYVEWEKRNPQPGEDIRQAASIETDIEDIAVVAFAKRTYIDLDEPLPDACRELCDDMIEKMVAHL